ncbi:MAG TPA: hypothetical protein VF322_12915 [Gammaproteobacteria bacterium]
MGNTPPRSGAPDEPTADGAASSAERRRALTDRLWYEYWMLRCTARLQPAEPALRQAVAESFALHVRNVVDFLYPPEPGLEAPSAELWLGERWRALRPPLSPVVAEARRRAGAVLADLGRSAEAAPDGALGAPRLVISQEIQKAMDLFVSHLPRAELGERWQIVYPEE